MAGFDSFIASHEIRISFLTQILTPPVPHIFFVIISSDIAIILTSENLYDYLLKLLQIHVCLCVSVIEVRRGGKKLVLCRPPPKESETQSVDVWLLNRLAAVEQHVSAGGLHRLFRHLSDHRVIKMVPGPSEGTVAQSRVVTHVQITCVILEKARRRWPFHATCIHLISGCAVVSIFHYYHKNKPLQFISLY